MPPFTGINGGNAVNLASLMGPLPTGGVFSRPGVSNGIFDPSGLAAGDYTLTYTIKVVFKPRSAGNRRATLMIQGSGAARVRISLRCREKARDPQSPFPIKKMPQSFIVKIATKPA